MEPFSESWWRFPFFCSAGWGGGDPSLSPDGRGGHLGVEGSPSPMPPSDRAVQLEEGPFGSGRAQPSPRLTRPHCLAADVPSPPCWPGRTDGGAEPLRRPPAVPPVPRKAINTRFHRQTKDANRRGGGRYNGVQTGSCPPSTHGITGPNPDPAPPKIPGPNPDPTPTPRIAWGPGWGQPPPNPIRAPHSQAGG